MSNQIPGSAESAQESYRKRVLDVLIDANQVPGVAAGAALPDRYDLPELSKEGLLAKIEASRSMVKEALAKSVISAEQADEIFGIQYMIEEILIGELEGYYIPALMELGEQIQTTLDIIEQLTLLINFANNIDIGTVPPFDFPPTNSSQLPAPDSEEYDKLIETMNDGIEGYPDDGKYGEEYGEGLGWDWGDAYADAYADDVAAAEALMAQNPGMTFEEAMAQQHKASDVLNEFMTSDSFQDEDFWEIQEILFSNFVSVAVGTSLSTEELEELWTSIIEVRDTLEDLLNVLDPLPPPEGQIPQRETPNTLAYFVQQVINDIDNVPGETGAEKAENWILLCLGNLDENGEYTPGTSSYMNNINLAVDAAKSLSDDQKVELKKMLMLLENFLSMLSSTIDQINQIIMNIAQVSGR